MNHMYLIVLQEYNEAGSLTSNVSYVYKDNPTDFAHAVDSYGKMMQTVSNGDGTEQVTTMKKYKVTPQMLCYATIDDMSEFKRVNHIGV